MGHTQGATEQYLAALKADPNDSVANQYLQHHKKLPAASKQAKQASHRYKQIHKLGDGNRTIRGSRAPIQEKSSSVRAGWRLEW